MVADVDLGALLSGGVDSSLIVAVMQSLSDRPVKTFSVGFEEPRYDEAPHAKRIARHLKTDHHEIYMKPADCLDVVQDQHGRASGRARVGQYVEISELSA